MNSSTPGEALPAELRERMWHYWRLKHRDLAHDPHAVWLACWRICTIETMRFSARWAGLVPAIREQRLAMDEILAFVEDEYAEAAEESDES